MDSFDLGDEKSDRNENVFISILAMKRVKEMKTFSFLSLSSLLRTKESNHMPPK